MIDESDFHRAVYLILREIPYGKVTTYGDVAKLTGYPKHSRHVGKLLSSLPENTELAWFRVINSSGKISLKGERFQRQKAKLIAEGVEVTENGRINLRRFRWQFGQ